MAKEEDFRGRCYAEGVTYSGRCRRRREEQLGQGAREEEVVEEVYIGENHRSLVTRPRVHFGLYKPRKGGREVMREKGISPEEDKELSKPGTWMREYTYSHHGGVLFEENTEYYEFVMLGVHRKVMRRQLEGAILIDLVLRKRSVQAQKSCVQSQQEDPKLKM